MASPLVRRDMFTGAPVPRAGLVISTILSMVTIAVLACCLMRRISAIKQWSKVPLTGWLIFAIYADSMLFITCTTILSHGFGLNTSQTVCSMAILLCLVCYMSTKLIYYFLVEKVYIIRRVSKPKLRSKLYLFNCFGMLFPYVICVILNFIFRIAYFDDKGTCIIGMELKAMMPLIIFDAVVNFYLTMLFVIPLRSLYSYKNNPNSALRTIALRSFVGSLGTLTSSVANLTVLMVLRGEAAWICLMCCNADILFSVVVLHWATTKDNSAANASLGSNGPYAHSGHNLKNGLAAGAVDESRVRDTKQFDNLETGLKAQFETCISARDLSDGIDEDMRREALGNGAAFPLDRIVVSVGQVRTVEGRSESGTTRSEVRSEISTNDDYVRRAVSHKSSTEDLVRENSPQ